MHLPKLKPTGIYFFQPEKYLKNPNLLFQQFGLFFFPPLFLFFDPSNLFLSSSLAVPDGTDFLKAKLRCTLKYVYD
jgi:hypothetical protein